MNLPKEKQSLTSLNYKILNIQSHLQNVDRDMNILSQEQQMWKEEKQEWQYSTIRQIQNLQIKVKGQLNAIYKEILTRNQHSQQAIRRVNSKIMGIRQVQNQCGNLINQLYHRIQDLQQILGK